MILNVRVAKPADAADLKSVGGLRLHEGSIPSSNTSFVLQSFPASDRSCLVEKSQVPRPQSDVTPDGRKIVYPIWRDDLAEALILPRSEPRDSSSDARP